MEVIASFLSSTPSFSTSTSTITYSSTSTITYSSTITSSSIRPDRSAFSLLDTSKTSE